MALSSDAPSAADLARAAAFANSIVGKRYPADGESPDGPETFNCWGVARLAARVLHGWELPAGPIDGIIDQVTQAKLLKLWRRLAGPAHGAIGYTSTTSAPRHIVVYLENDRGVVLHALEHHGVVCWPLRQLATYGFLDPVWYLPRSPDGAAAAMGVAA